MTTFTKAEIAVEKTEAFAKLKDAISAALTGKAESFLKTIISAKIRAREFEPMLQQAIFDRVNGLQKGTAQRWYDELSLSDRGLAREFFLTQVEQVDVALRSRYKAAYRYQ
jgi:hypothetical protein